MSRQDLKVLLEKRQKEWASSRFKNNVTAPPCPYAQRVKVDFWEVLKRNVGSEK